MQVGVGRAEIIFPPDFFPTEGFTIQYSPLHTRLVLFYGNIHFALLSVEMTSLPDSDVAEIQALVSRITGVDKQCCWVCVTHTFSAPHILPDRALNNDTDRHKREQLRKLLAEAVTRAAQQAVTTMVTAELSLGNSICGVNTNRDIETADGWWIGAGGNGPVDRLLHLLSVTDLQGKPLALLFHYSIQSSVMDGLHLLCGGRVACGDLVGVAAARLEQDYPDAVAVFIMGAAGDQGPLCTARNGDDLHEQGQNICNELGTRLADAVQEAYNVAEAIKDPTIVRQQQSFTAPAQKMPVKMRDLCPTHNYDFVPDGVCETTIEALRIGDIAILGVRPEINFITAGNIVDVSPFGTTLLATMVNGGAKYMADAASYDRITYQAMNSHFGRGAAELLEEQAAQLLANIF